MKLTNLNQQRDYEGLVAFCEKLLPAEKAKKVADAIFVEDYPRIVEMNEDALDAYKAMLQLALMVCLSNCEAKAWDLCPN